MARAGGEGERQPGDVGARGGVLYGKVLWLPPPGPSHGGARAGQLLQGLGRLAAPPTLCCRLQSRALPTLHQPLPGALPVPDPSVRGRESLPPPLHTQQTEAREVRNSCAGLSGKRGSCGLSQAFLTEEPPMAPLGPWPRPSGPPADDIELLPGLQAGPLASPSVR